MPIIDVDDGVLIDDEDLVEDVSCVEKLDEGTEEDVKVKSDDCLLFNGFLIFVGLPDVNVGLNVIVDDVVDTVFLVL